MVYRLLLQHRSIRQFIKFGIVGACNMTIDVSIFFILTAGLAFFRQYYLVANAIAWMGAVTFSFFANKFWTFRADDRSAIYHEYGKFFSVSIIALGLSQVLLYVGVETLALGMVYAKFSAVVLVSFWNFFMNKFWTFKK